MYRREGEKIIFTVGDNYQEIIYYPVVSLKADDIRSIDAMIMVAYGMGKTYANDKTRYSGN